MPLWIDITRQFSNLVWLPHLVKLLSNISRLLRSLIYVTPAWQIAGKLDKPRTSSRLVAGHDFSRAERAQNQRGLQPPRDVFRGCLRNGIFSASSSDKPPLAHPVAPSASRAKAWKLLRPFNNHHRARSQFECRINQPFFSHRYLDLLLVGCTRTGRDEPPDLGARAGTHA